MDDLTVRLVAIAVAAVVVALFASVLKRVRSRPLRSIAVTGLDPGTYLFTSDPSALGDDDSFQELRHIDSMGMMQLIQFIETEFGIRLVEDDLIPEKLDSVNRLVRLIADKQARRP